MTVRVAKILGAQRSIITVHSALLDTIGPSENCPIKRLSNKPKDSDSNNIVYYQTNKRNVALLTAGRSAAALRSPRLCDVCERSPGQVTAARAVSGRSGYGRCAHVAGRVLQRLKPSC